MAPRTVGLIVAHRGFFPGHLCAEARQAFERLLSARGIRTVSLSPRQTRYGAVSTRKDAEKCAALFDEHRGEIDGIIVTLPNFGDERSAADAIRLSGLSVPVLLHAWPDDPGRMSGSTRRDSFCGKISIANNLRQYRIPFSLTSSHTIDPQAPSFAADLDRFLAVCRVVRGLKHARFGAVGARPAAFKTVRFSEKLLESAGIAVETIDLSDLFAAAQKVPVRDAQQSAAEISRRIRCAGVPKGALLRMARLRCALQRWIDENGLSGVAIQCWTSMEENYGVVPCAVMSILSEDGVPAACEVDITGCLSMHILKTASETPAALLDWNNNYGDDANKAVVFHCSNLPSSFFPSCRMEAQEIIAATVGRENAWGTVCGRIASGPFTFLRLTTDDLSGKIAGYAGEGRFTDDPLDTFGGYGVVEIPRLQDLLRHLCRNGYEHHVAACRARVAEAVSEAITTYLDWNLAVHPHQTTERSMHED